MNITISAWMWVRDILETLARDEDGQDMIEYGLLASILSVAAVILIVGVGPYIQHSYTQIAGQLAYALGPH